MPLPDPPKMPDARRLASLLLLCTAAAVHADELADIQRLKASGRAAAALPIADRALAARPRDAQLRFARGVLLADLKRDAEAAEVFRSLNQDHPELAEPYNNLAVLLAARGETDAARAALEQALRARPDYAAAQENLGDVHVMLAARAYAQAGRLDSGNRSAPAKLRLAQNLLNPAARP